MPKVPNRGPGASSSQQRAERLGRARIIGAVVIGLLVLAVVAVNAARRSTVPVPGNGPRAGLKPCSAVPDSPRVVTCRQGRAEVQQTAGSASAPSRAVRAGDLEVRLLSGRIAPEPGRPEAAFSLAVDAIDSAGATFNADNSQVVLVVGNQRLQAKTDRAGEGTFDVLGDGFQTGRVRFDLGEDALRTLRTAPAALEFKAFTRSPGSPQLAIVKVRLKVPAGSAPADTGATA